MTEFKKFRHTFAQGEVGAVSAAPNTAVAKLYREDNNPPGGHYLLLLIHHNPGPLNMTVTF